VPGGVGVAGGLLGGVGGQGGGEHGLAVRAEEPLGDERRNSLADGLLAHRDARVVGVLGGEAGVGVVVGADVVGVGASLPVPFGDAVHAALAGVAAQAGAERVAAAGLGGGHLRVAGVAALAGDLLGGVPGGPVDQGRVGRLRRPQPVRLRDGALLAVDGALAAEHHVPGVFRVAQDPGHGGLRPPGAVG
jgi:hypothetical protein